MCVRVIGLREGCFDEWQPNDPRGYDMPFWAARFRPLVERMTDISVFTEVKQKEPA